MRAADDFATIRARMKELEQERDPRDPCERDDWRMDRVELARVTREKTRELLRRA